MDSGFDVSAVTVDRFDILHKMELFKPNESHFLRVMQVKEIEYIEKTNSYKILLGVPIDCPHHMYREPFTITVVGELPEKAKVNGFFYITQGGKKFFDDHLRPGYTRAYTLPNVIDEKYAESLVYEFRYYGAGSSWFCVAYLLDGMFEVCGSGNCIAIDIESKKTVDEIKEIAKKDCLKQIVNLETYRKNIEILEWEYNLPESLKSGFDGVV